METTTIRVPRTEMNVHTKHKLSDIAGVIVICIFGLGAIVMLVFGILYLTGPSETPDSVDGLVTEQIENTTDTRQLPYSMTVNVNIPPNDMITKTLHSNEYSSEPHIKKKI